MTWWFGKKAGLELAQKVQQLAQQVEPLPQQVQQLSQSVQSLTQQVQGLAQPVDPYAEEIKQLDQEAQDLSRRLTLALRYQRNNRLRERVERLEEEVGIAPKKGETSATTRQGT